jgi:hypothetical protein
LEHSEFVLAGGSVIGRDHRRTFKNYQDGSLIVRNSECTLGPFPDNQPPYAGYGLLGKRGLEVQTVKTCPLSGLQHFLIGTDGVSDLIAARGNCLPGMNGQVGPVSQFWDEERYLGGNPDLVSRRLRVIGRDWPKRDPEPGLLPDDTTLIVGRAANS